MEVNAIQPVGSPDPHRSVKKPQGQPDSSPSYLQSTVVSTSNNFNFFDHIKIFFETAVTAIGLVFGYTGISNEPYTKLIEGLKTATSSLTTNEDRIKARAEYLFCESKRVLDHVNENIAKGAKTTDAQLAGLETDKFAGVKMSAELISLCGNTPEQLYFHNVAVNYWAGVELGIYSPDDSPDKVLQAYSVDDHDNTWVNKNWDPSDTGLVQGLKTIHLGRKIFELGKNKLKVQEWINTARGPFSTIIQLIPEGLNRYVTKAQLHSAILERFGYRKEDKLAAFDNSALIALNSSVVQKPNEPLKLSAKILRETEIFEWFESENGPRINGMTFHENILHQINGHNCSVLEAKSLPKYVLDSYKTMPEFHLKMYEKIISLKEEIVGDKDNDKQAWLDFARAIREDVRVGEAAWKRLDGNANDFVDDGVSLEGKRKAAFEHIRLPGDSITPISTSDSGKITNYWNLIDENSEHFNPKAFFIKVREAVLITPVAHIYDNHGSPALEALDEIKSVLEAFSSNPRVRRRVAELNKQTNKQQTDDKKLHRDIENFVTIGVEKFKDQGIEAYLKWRVLKYFEAHYDKKQLGNIKAISNGKEMFDVREKNLSFSTSYRREINELNPQQFVDKLTHDIQGTNISPDLLKGIIETFLPEGSNFNGQISRSESLRNNAPYDLKKETFFYPNELYHVNSCLAYNDKQYVFNSILNLVIKRSELDKLGQYYWELQPNREKHLGIPGFDSVIDKKLKVHTAGDSKSDVGMMASALERGGAASVVFSLIQNPDIYKEIIKQRIGYVKDFRENPELFKKCKEKLGIHYALEETDGGYFKVTGFKEEIDPETGDIEIINIRECNAEGNPYSLEELLGEFKERYQSRIIRNTSPESYIRRRAEIFGLLAGENIEFDKNAGYDWANAVVEKGSYIPEEAPRTNIFNQWRGKDFQGESVVYRSKKHSGSLVIDRLNGEEPILFTLGEEALGHFTRYDIGLNNNGRLAYLNVKNKRSDLTTKEGELTRDEIVRLEDYALENKYILHPTKAEGLFANRFLLKVFGKNNIKKLIDNLPNLFGGLLKYSGIIMGAGGVLRLLSPLTGGLQEGFYKIGYWASNGLRAVSALGGALRGELNVHKYHNIAFGEAINVVSSFLPNGIKHLGLGLGNFVLFLGRGQYRAQAQQRVNNHTKKELEKGKILDVDPRDYVRNVTKLATDVVLSVKEKVKENGMSAFTGELLGNLVSAIATPIQMVKDLWNDKRLITQVVSKIAEKCGSYYKSVPSVAHLLTLVGLFSGASAALAGTVGRTGEKDETGFNLFGKLAIAFSNAIPALGIIFNAKEVMANPTGLPLLYGDLNRQDQTYDPKKAGMSQIVAGAGFAAVPWFGLHNKYIASLFDIFNGIYFMGAAEEEKPNTNMLGRNIKRKDHVFYENTKEDYQHIDFIDESTNVQAAV